MTLGKLIKKRKVFKVIGSITEETLKTFLYQINDVDSVIIHSSGGDVNAMHSMATLIRSAGLDTIGLERVQSAAVSLFLAGKNRYALETTMFMTHPITCTSWTSNIFNSPANKALKASRSNTDKLHKMLGSTAVVPLKETTFYTCEEAQKMGWVTKVLTV